VGNNASEGDPCAATGLSSPIVSVFPLGAHVDPDGARFAVASASAEAVEVCLVDGGLGELTERRVALTERTFGVWHGHVPGVVAGQRYGYRVHGPYRPWEGLRANPAKILVDPYARRVTGAVTDLEPVVGVGRSTVRRISVSRARSHRPEPGPVRVR